MRGGISILFCGALIGLAGCDSVGFLGQGAREAESAPLEAPLSDAPPVSATETSDTSQTSQTPEAAAPTPEAEAAAAGGSRELGRTIASLGDPTAPGLWMETGLVTSAQPGRLTYPATGKSVKVELRPSGREPGAGSQVSLAALRALEAPLTDLPELVVVAEPS